MLADVVDLGEHGPLVDELIVLAHAAAVPDKGERHAFLIQRLFEHDAVLVVHESRGVCLRAEAGDADRDVDRLAREGERLALDEVDLPDVELIELDGDVDAWTDADR